MRSAIFGILLTVTTCDAGIVLAVGDYTFHPDDIAAELGDGWGVVGIEIESTSDLIDNLDGWVAANEFDVLWGNFGVAAALDGTSVERYDQALIEFAQSTQLPRVFTTAPRYPWADEGINQTIEDYGRSARQRLPSLGVLVDDNLLHGGDTPEIAEAILQATAIPEFSPWKLLLILVVGMALAYLIRHAINHRNRGD